MVPAPCLVASLLMGWREQEGMALPCLLLHSFPADLQWNGVAQWLQLSFSCTFSSRPAQRSGRAHSLGLPWADQEDHSTVKPQISSEGRGKLQEL